MVETRVNPRQRSLKEGRLVFNGRNSVVSCIIRDMSEGGLRVKCGEPYLLPAEFDIVVRGDGAPRPARRVWTKDSEMGIAYRSVPAD